MKCISYFADAFQLTSGHSAIGKKKKKTLGKNVANDKSAMFQNHLYPHYTADGCRPFILSSL